MIKTFLLQACILAAFTTNGQIFLVKNETELIKANKEAKPGNTILLQNGVWNDIKLVFDATGTKDKPITLKAQSNGKVIITGKSSLHIGGSFLIIDGLFFDKGYSGEDAAINFKSKKGQVANDCRVTNTVINDYNNPYRMDENYWVSLYGKNNRIDHCSFFNKKNMGVMLAVILDDDRSRENNHSIDHNYFGGRPPLASNSGEIIRVGVSQHCEFNSNTQIIDNFFEKCDGETEIISIKSCGNVIRKNTFKECQGAVVLRHGNFNTVENNIFLGNNKRGTGGVRIINKGQWVVNNLFYQCRGTGFRSPLAVMNGVPNSPAFRYVPVSDAVIANNSFVDCTALSFCEGSDEERSEIPKNVFFTNNIVYNKKDNHIYESFDNMNGIHFEGNLVNNTTLHKQESAFEQSLISMKTTGKINLPVTSSLKASGTIDSLNKTIRTGLLGKLSSTPGFSAKGNMWQNYDPLFLGANWFKNASLVNHKKQTTVFCENTAELLLQLKNKGDRDLIIFLTGREYVFDAPIVVQTNILITSSTKSDIHFTMNSSKNPFFLMINAGTKFSMNNVHLDLSKANTPVFITTDTSGNSNHSNISFQNCSFNKLLGTFFNAAKSSVTDKMMVSNCTFSHNNGTILNLDAETDKKGLYNVEVLSMNNCTINNHQGHIISMLRSGKDESTMGPSVSFFKNIVKDCNSKDSSALIYLYGIQESNIYANSFSNSNKLSILMKMEDVVRAEHNVRDNRCINSGIVIGNKYLKSKNNIFK